jgi:hypothetical protein
MVIDARNAGAEVNPAVNGVYYIDRWYAGASVAGKFKIGQNAGAVTPPNGFTNYLGCTSLSAYAVGTSENFRIQQNIEGFNVADLGWGTANAKTVTLSFWVRSSLTGTFGGAIRNNAVDRSYPFTFTINAANTFEYKTVTIEGDTSGTWLTNNGVGMAVSFSLGAGSTFTNTAGAWAAGNFNSATGATSVVGTDGATFYITGVQLEVGTQATSFEYRQYQQELALCQRYYYRTTPEASARVVTSGYNSSTTIHNGVGSFPVPLRITPTALEQSGTASNYSVAYLATSSTASAVPTFDSRTSNTMYVVQITTTGLTAGQASQGRSQNASGYLAWSAEL